MPVESTSYFKEISSIFIYRDFARPGFFSSMEGLINILAKSAQGILGYLFSLLCRQTFCLGGNLLFGLALLDQVLFCRQSHPNFLLRNNLWKRRWKGSVYHLWRYLKENLNFTKLLLKIYFFRWNECSWFSFKVSPLWEVDSCSWFG